MSVVRRRLPLAAAMAGTLVAVAFACRAIATTGDPGDAPDPLVARPVPAIAPPTWADAIRAWRSAEDVNAWIGARFEYDPERALALSETARAASGPVSIPSPRDFFGKPRGVCVDLARFGVDTLRAIDPDAHPAYLMIEFEPATIEGRVFRRHWLATFVRDGKRWFYADSKRPGVLAGPYDSVDAFLAEYSSYRGRTVVAWREVESHEKRARTAAAAGARTAARPAVLP